MSGFITGACACTGRCREPNGSCSAWPHGYGKFSPYSYDLNFKDNVYNQLRENAAKIKELEKRIVELELQANEL